jgi:hypothetical protein
MVRHAPSGRFLGVALVLVDRAEAIRFESASAAERFLERHASEPCYDVVAAATPLAA